MYIIREKLSFCIIVNLYLWKYNKLQLSPDTIVNISENLNLFLQSFRKLLLYYTITFFSRNIDTAIVSVNKWWRKWWLNWKSATIVHKYNKQVLLVLHYKTKTNRMGVITGHCKLIKEHAKTSMRTNAIHKLNFIIFNLIKKI